MKNIYRAFRRFLFFILVGIAGVCCNKQKSTESDFPRIELQLISVKVLPFTEPSGIAFSESMQKMWIVSGGDQHIYMLDTAGNVEKKLSYTGIDLEGISFDATDSTLWIVDEGTKEVVHLDRKGNVLFRKIVEYTTLPNKGPEGITLGKNHEIYIVNEREPGILFELDSTYSLSKSYQLNFALDYSDISYDLSTDSFFILSDESGAFYQWNKQQGVINVYPLPNMKNEGIAYNRQRNLFYIVNDETAELYFFKAIKY
jgi:uncharacterized protein YjiK